MSDSNVYAAPESNLDADEAGANNMELAGKGRRFGTLIVDYNGFFIFSIVLGAIIGFVFRGTGASFMKQNSLLSGCLIIIAYYVIFEGLWSRTPGKLVFGTMVINEAGGKPSLGQVAIRSLCRFIPFEGFSFLGTRGWHDSLSKTYVVLKNKS
jgi:uncharacterized RDD family membrane protein YckC